MLLDTVAVNLSYLFLFKRLRKKKNIDTIPLSVLPLKTDDSKPVQQSATVCPLRLF
jgi:hypothetical protein